MSYDLTRSPQSDPTLLYRYRDGVHAIDLLIVGLHLDFFSWLDRQPSTQAEVCEAFEFADRPVDVMLTLFTAMGLIQRHGDVFELTATGREHLVRESPWYLGPYYPPLADRPIARDLLQVLRTGKPANWATHQAGADWHAAMETEEFAETFTAAMDCRGLYLSQAVARAVDLGQYGHLLDIGGGSGIYACALAAHNPDIRVTVLEKPPVDRITRRAIERRGMADRVSTTARDMLRDPLPADADVHLYSNVLHDWDVPVVEALLRRSFEALPSSGLIVVHDAFLDADKAGPLHVAEYSVMLVHASEGRCYSLAEMTTYLEAAGFSGCAYKEGGARRGVMTARKP